MIQNTYIIRKGFYDRSTDTFIEEDTFRSSDREEALKELVHHLKMNMEELYRGATCKNIDVLECMASFKHNERPVTWKCNAKSTHSGFRIEIEKGVKNPKGAFNTIILHKLNIN